MPRQSECENIITLSNSPACESHILEPAGEFFCIIARCAYAKNISGSADYFGEAGPVGHVGHVGRIVVLLWIGG